MASRASGLRPPHRPATLGYRSARQTPTRHVPLAKQCDATRASGPSAGYSMNFRDHRGPTLRPARAEVQAAGAPSMDRRTPRHGSACHPPHPRLSGTLTPCLASLMEKHREGTGSPRVGLARLCVASGKPRTSLSLFLYPKQHISEFCLDS